MTHVFVRSAVRSTACGATTPGSPPCPGFAPRSHSNRAWRKQSNGCDARRISLGTRSKSTMSRRAVILAGGRGTRLRPYTVVLPKPLMPIGEFPILEVIVRQLAAAGFDHVTMAVNRQAELIKAFFQDGAKWKVQIGQFPGGKALGAHGPLRLVWALAEPFFGNERGVLKDLDFARLFE